MGERGNDFFLYFDLTEEQHQHNVCSCVGCLSCMIVEVIKNLRNVFFFVKKTVNPKLFTELPFSFRSLNHPSHNHHEGFDFTRDKYYNL